MRLVRRSVVFAAAAVVAITAVAQEQQKDPKKDPDQIGARDVSKGVNWYSINQEMQLGKALAAQVARNARLIDDPVISEYVNRVGQNLVRNSDSKFPFIIKVIEDDSVNAVSLPGGYFFVNTGLILTADTESELAGGMAHEIAHIAARHVTRQLTRDQIAQMATIPLILMGGWAGYGARQAAGLMIPMTMLQFGRAFESEADLLGLEYLYKTGYDPNGMIDIFEKIQTLDRQPGRVSKLFQTHPPTGDRIVTVQKSIQELLKEQPQYVVTTSEFDQVKARLAMLQKRRKGDAPNPNRPKLKKAPEQKMAESVKLTGPAPQPAL